MTQSVITDTDKAASQNAVRQKMQAPAQFVLQLEPAEVWAFWMRFFRK